MPGADRWGRAGSCAQRTSGDRRRESARGFRVEREPVGGFVPEPLALQLACRVGSVRRADRNLTADEVAGLPHDVGGLFAQLWDELPANTREVLMVAALSTPAAISDSVGFGDARWDALLLTAV